MQQIKEISSKYVAGVFICIIFSKIGAEIFPPQFIELLVNYLFVNYQHFGLHRTIRSTPLSNFAESPIPPWFIVDILPTPVWKVLAKLYAFDWFVSALLPVSPLISKTYVSKTILSRIINVK